NVKMADAPTDLDELVVIGYGVQKKALVTGANLNVKGDQIAELNTSTAMEALQGIATGISVTRNSGAPGAGTKATIRGLGTIGNSAPLYIVDGVSVGNIDYLHSSDIESIDVLKDAASSAIYGSRAANGVILVTTKKGVKGAAPVITYDFYYGMQNIYKKLPALNAQEYMFIMDEGRANDGLAPNNWEAMLQNNSFLNSNFPGNLGTKLGEYVWDNLEAGWEGTDWVSEMSTKNAPVQNHSINITGSAKDVTYAMGFSYFDQTGILGGDLMGAGYKRITARLNTEMALIKGTSRDIVTIGENFTLTNTQNKWIGTGNIYWNDLHNALVTNPLLPAYWDQSPDPNGFTPTLEGISLGQHNPLAMLYYNRSNFQWGKGNTVTGNAYINIEPMKNLKLRSSFGINSWFGNSRSWSPTYQLATQYNNANDAVTQEMYQGINFTWTNTVSYEFKIDEHKIALLAGNEILDNILNANVGGWKANSIFGSPDYAYLNNVVAGQISDINTYGADWAAQGGGLLSYYGRFSYNFREKYIFDATFRADGSSNFAKDQRWGYFPSASAGWIFSEEDFMSDKTWLSFGKLRASWGQNGNQSIDNFIYSSNIDYLDQGYYFGPDKLVTSPTAIPANVPNPDVTWETSEQLNIGVDARFFNSNLGLSIDWYNKMTKDWLVLAPILGTAGAGAPWINGGDIKNTGIEFTISWKSEVSDFIYGASFSGTMNKNEVTRLANAEGIINGSAHVLSQGTAAVSRVEVGFPIGFFYGLKTDGLLQNQTDVDAYVRPDGKPYFEDQRPGDVKFVDQNLDGLINDDDKVMLGSPLPKFEMGLQLNAEYKGIYANATLTGKFGMQIMQSYRSFADNFTQNYTTQIFGRWHGEGTSDRIPRLGYASTRNINLISDIYMHDADYVRLSNVVLGYRLGNLFGNQKWLKGASVYASVNNLYTFTKYDGMDPDVGYAPDSWASGVDLGLYPLPRTVMFGASVTF
ncbi:MAG TPA: SusC/RagA family TonB-linked outer membrane protein, partial [Bacteroidales bacterium]|nr:SusC/RagA family TonB-linked outer membrane protein [Bacteroidales bacterium]